eukprot:6403874-Pyramimonas_sp.AAC.1
MSLRVCAALHSSPLPVQCFCDWVRTAAASVSPAAVGYPRRFAQGQFAEFVPHPSTTASPFHNTVPVQFFIRRLQKRGVGDG